MHAHASEGATTLVWVDREEAIIVRWADRALLERIAAERPDADDASTVTPGGLAHAAPRGEREGIRGFAAAIAARVPPGDDVTVVGPGILRGSLERILRAEDRRLGRRRLVHATASDRLSEPELVARVRARAGVAADGVDGVGGDRGEDPEAPPRA
jgi:hypothetical protein